MQVGWFHLLADIGAVAASANLFVNYLAAFLPWGLNTWDRDSMMAILIAIPAVANYVGVRSGANLSNLMTVAKISPLALLIRLVWVPACWRVRSFMRCCSSLLWRPFA